MSALLFAVALLFFYCGYLLIRAVDWWEQRTGNTLAAALVGYTGVVLSVVCGFAGIVAVLATIIRITIKE